MKGKLKHYLLTWLRLTNRPTVKVYRGFGNTTELTIHGSVFRRSALSRKKYRQNKWLNLLAVVRLFMVRPYPQATVRVQYGTQTADTLSDDDGYFRFSLPLDQPLLPGWHPVSAQLVSETITKKTVLAEGTGEVLVPHPTQLACISDIDDTFLISHSSTILKRMKVLLTRNAHSRKPFEGVVAHYQLLAEANSGSDKTNAFFYVSSSEWNLYDYILDFSKKNGLPDGVYLLSQLKQLKGLLKTGQNKHKTKFTRIVRLLETFPAQQFILLGDDTQEDPVIYASVVEHFPGQIRCVYIRQVNEKNRLETQATLSRIQAAGVPCCYFAHSAEARQHSVDSGFVES
nr:phosphatase domain-containing protein [Spirosoma utsteinense]